jgi:flagellar biosynthesis protein FlhG
MLGQAERLYNLSRLKTKEKTAVRKNIVSFTSGKGGTGKTVLAVNTAYALSKQNKKVLLIDLDSNLSNINILLNVYAENTLNNFLSGSKLFPELIYKHNENLHIIFGDSGNAEYPKPRNEIIAFIITQLKKIQSNYDYVIIDSSAGIDEDVLTILKNSDLNIVVTTTEPTAVMDAYVVLKILKRNNILNNSRILINKCFNELEATAAKENLKQAAFHFLKEEILFLGLIDFDIAVNRSIIDQNILLEQHPELRTSAQIEAIASGFEKLIHVVNNSQPASSLTS